MAPAIFLMGLGPLARWKKSSLPELAIRMRWAFGVSMITALLLPLTMGEWKVMVSFGLLLAFWVITSIFVSLWQRIKNSSHQGLFTKLAKQSRSYYGMNFAHFGIAIFIIGVTMVNGYETEKDVRMDVGDTVAIGGYTFRFNGTNEVPGPNYQGIVGDIEVLNNGERINLMHPEKRTYNASGMAMTEAAIDTGIFRDLYVALGEPLGDGSWVVRVYHKPFVDWVWFGCLLMAFGGALAVSDKRYRIKVRKLSEKKIEETETETETGIDPLVTETRKA
jgi:cytochrome c-type biogenesis protein CcmF